MRWFSASVHALSKDGERVSALFLDHKHYNQQMLWRIRKELEYYSSVKAHDYVETLIGVSWDKPGTLIIVFGQRGPLTLNEVLHGGTDDPNCTPKHTTWKDGLIDYAIHVAKGLKHLHSFKYPHFDVRPHNIFINNKKASLCNVLEHRFRSLLGLDYSDYKFPEYLAPEILKEDLYDDKADIFAFGITLNELDTHEKPYTDAVRKTSSFRAVESSFKGKRPSLHHKSSSVRKLYESPDELKKLIVRCWQTNAKDRPTAARILDDLLDIRRLLLKQETKESCLVAQVLRRGRRQETQ